MLIENLCVVIPAKNEAEYIAEIIKGCKQFTSNIIVSDGNSKDATRDIAAKLNAKSS